jgi:putative PIN family toxin of toxin-antitoxin system
MSAAEKVVFDCNVYFQCLISDRGPAAQCFAACQQGTLALITSQRIIHEFRVVCLRPSIARRFRLTETRMDAFIAEILSTAAIIDDIPHVFDYERDPNDAHYVDLAVACQAKIIVTRDRDLLALGDPRDPFGAAFQRRFPEISILTPVEMLMRLKEQVEEE